MSKRSADDEEENITAKKAKRDENASDTGSQPSDSQLKKDEDGNYYFDLGNMKRATVNMFKGTAQLNIREYYTDKNGDIKPGRKGITLNRSQWDLFVSGIEPLSERLKTIETEKREEPSKSKSKKKSEEKTTKKKTGEKPAKKKKKKKDESEDEGSDDE